MVPGRRRRQNFDRARESNSAAAGMTGRPAAVFAASSRQYAGQSSL